MTFDCIHIHGARQHNLRNIDVRIPRRSLTVVTGLSGSGKSSLAFDTLYAEGQRRYVESLSAYARQFLERLQKPDVERIDGLAPAIAIEQRSSGNNPRSTVATVTEIHDYLRLLYAHAGQPHCPRCGQPIAGQSAQSISDHLLALPAGEKLVLLAPYVVGRKGEHREILDQMRRQGFARARIDGDMVPLDTDIVLKKTRSHTLEAVVDRLISGSASPARLTDSVELALRTGAGAMTVLVEDDSAPHGWREEPFSERLACKLCGLSFGDLEPRNFSFNSPYGACPTCHGIGARPVFLPELVIPDPSLSIKRGAIPLWRRGPRRLITYYNRLLRAVAEHCNVDLATPWQELPEDVQGVFLHGTGDVEITFEHWRGGRRHKTIKPFEGILPNLQRRFHETKSDAVREALRKCMGREICPDCRGARLRPESLAVTVGGQSIHKFTNLSIDDALTAVERLELTAEQEVIARDIVREIRARLRFLIDVGVQYLTLERESGTLSGGEAQRIRLATQLGSGLVGVLYVLDEPTIGLHPRDTMRLLDTLKQLRDLGNTVVIVEHDPETIRQADYVIDLGPGAGRHGGELIYQGTPENIRNCERSLTGMYLSGQCQIPMPAERVSGTHGRLSVVGAAEHNLKNITVALPLGTLCCVTGVSGAGKSTLVDDILKNAVYRHFSIRAPQPGRHTRIDGLENLDKMIVIDQSPIGRTPRSNPATYTDTFNVIRQLFAKLPESRMRGYKPARFSFNLKGGRCEDCKGDGIKRIEMAFLPDVYVQCETCGGKRYNRETLTVLYRGMSIADVLEMTVDRALEFFAAVPQLKRRLETLSAVGLGYIHLGQPATTLSGGEAQRVKLAAELARRATGHTLYILDEPTSGLHLADIRKLLTVLQSLRDQGNTVLIVEHNLDVIKVADHVVDLGPDGGEAGGMVVAEGTPEQIAACDRSHTGRFLKNVLRPIRTPSHAGVPGMDAGSVQTDPSPFNKDRKRP